MDRLSVLPEDLLIKILSIVPTKVAVSTSILSKRWEYLWMLLPKLEYVCRNSSSDDSSPANPYIFPRNLYTSKSLVILKLDGDILLDVPPMVYLPSLKTLHLKNTRYFTEESLRRLLSNCPVLEDLVVDLREEDNMRELTVVSTSLQSLSIYIPALYDIDGVVIKTPCLKYLKHVDHNMTGHHYCLTENMPNLIEAYLDVDLPNIQIQGLMESLTFVKHLAICSLTIYHECVVYNQLRHLQLCSCNLYSSDLLVRLLKDAPHLQVLDIFKMNGHCLNQMVGWSQPSTVPECVLSSLQTFNWYGYAGEPVERDIVVYILKNAFQLRTTTIRYDNLEVLECEMRQELELSSRASTTCQIVFDPMYY